MQRFLKKKKKKLGLPYDPAVLLLGIHLDKTITCKDNMHLYVNNSAIHSSQDTETI